MNRKLEDLYDNISMVEDIIRFGNLSEESLLKCLCDMNKLRGEIERIEYVEHKTTKDLKKLTGWEYLGLLRDGGV